jgi:CheY-like chemotaxis protein/HPt (histidine-containing phosphotransfer) domain-containing protein
VAIAAGRGSPEIVQRKAAEAVPAQTTAPTVEEARVRGRLILVAEDDPVNQTVILRQLALLGHAAEVADNGREALERWRRGDYALLLTDLHMPEMDGYGLAEAIRREERDDSRMPVVALTANALRGETARAYAAGMDEYLTKPVRLETLRTTLQKWMPEPKGSPGGEPQAGRGPRTSSATERGAREAPVFDAAVLRTLVGGEEVALRGVLEEYRVSLRTNGAELRSAVEAGDGPRVRAVAHRLKSSSRSVGAMALGGLLADVEAAGRAGDLEAARALVERVDALMTATDEAVADRLREE